MILKIKRSQRTGGIMGGKVIFCLDIRADYSPEEREAINKYNIGGEIVYSSEAAKRHSANAGAHLSEGSGGGLAKGIWSMALAGMNLNITIASLQKGHHVECKDMGELLQAENVLREAAKGLTMHLEAAKTFDGRELVVEYVRGEEQLHRPESALVG